MPLERPQTANVLSAIRKFVFNFQTNSCSIKEGNQFGYGSRVHGNPSTAASSNQQDKFYSSRGFGELGSTKRIRAQNQKIDLVNSESLRDDMSSSDENEKHNILDQGPNDRVTCPNCKENMLFRELAAHTV